MTEKYIIYKMDGRTYKVPESKSAIVEKKYPNASIEMHMDDKVYNVPVSHKAQAISKYPNVSYVFGNEERDDETASIVEESKADTPELETQNNYSTENEIEESPSFIDAINNPDLSRREKRKAIKEARKSGEIPSLGETIGKGGGAAAVTLGKGAVDITNTSAKLGASTPIYNNPLTGLAATIEAITGKSVLDEDNPLNAVSEKLGKKAEKLSKEADPTGGEMDFFDLVKTGNIGLALQKGVGSSMESIPIMAMSKNPYLATYWILSNAASGYEDEMRENPDIPAWKAGLNSLLGSTLELAIEKVADPLEDLIKGGKGVLTDDAAKKILDVFTEEGTETIAGRIFNYLGHLGKKTVKNAGGEAIEEGATALGNDAIGSALDAIDQNDDYGFTAQWKEYKKQNPDASLWDFCMYKGRGYINAMLGGVFSGANVSAASTALADAINLRYENKTNNHLEQLRNYGASLGEDKYYDVDADVAEAANNLASSFTNNNGESEISREFLDNLTSKQAATLSQRADIPAAQKTALYEYAKKKSIQEGLNEKYDLYLENNIKTQNLLIDSAAENGVVVTGFYNGNPVLVKGGVVNDSGAVTLPNGSNGPVIVIDSQTREKTTVNSKDIQRAFSQNEAEYRTTIENQLRENDAHNRDVWRNTMSLSAKFRAIQPYANSKIVINSSNGMTEVEVLNITKHGMVLIKGKKGDLGQSEVLIPADLFYDSIARNEDGTPVFVEKLPQKEQVTETPVAEPTPQPEAPVAPAEPQDFSEYSGTIVINGVPVNVNVTDFDKTADRVNYTYIDANGVERAGSTTVAGFAQAVQEAKNMQTEAPVIETPTENVTPEPAPVPEVPPTTTEIPPQSDNTPIPTQSINWDALLESDPEAYFTEMQNRFGDRTGKKIDAVISFLQSRIDTLNKAKAKTESIGDVLDIDDQIDALQSKIDILNGMVARLASPAPEVAPTTPATPAQPVTPAPAQPTVSQQPTDNVPDVSVDKAADARARGFRMTNGQRVDRRGETTGAYGKDTDVTFTADSKGKRTGKVKVIDAGSLVPSHIRGVENVEHFLPEAQPKKRTDTASTVSATLIAQNMDSPKMTNVASSAYEGAPIVNRRGEVIQGNNRSAAILEMYQSYPEKSAEYKQYIIDHAADFGLNAEEVAAMQNPVLVRELDVDDTDAIALGQYTMQDMESGGNQMIDSNRAIAGLNNKGLMADFISILLAEENEETSDMNLSDLITRNGNEALKLLSQNGIINQTQYQSALGANGRVTADARAALRGIIEQQLFAGGIDNLSVMFEVLPDKAKKAIMQTIARDLKNPDDAKVTPYLQEAIEVYYQLNQQPDFVAAKSDEEISKAINAFKGQTNALEAGTPADKYSNFAFELAFLFKAKTLKYQREKLNQLYDTIAGVADIFGEGEGKPLGEAVEEVYGTNLNKANNETNGQSGAAVLEGGNGGSQEGQQGSTGSVAKGPEASGSGQGTTTGGANKTVGGSTQTTGEVTPVAPNPVADPITEAKKIELHLAIQLNRNLEDGQKEDLARSLGKKIGDLFATREEYEAYQESATDFGQYNNYVELGVEDSFAERQQNTGTSQENGVTLETEPKQGDNGTETGTETPEGTEGYNGTTGGQHTDDEGGKEGTQEAEGLRGGDVNQEIKYPAREGDATRQLLMDTFGFTSVSPGVSQENLNDVYDFLMEMSKMLGISPTSIGHGATLGMGVLGEGRIGTLAAYQYRASWDGTIKEPYLRFKNSLLSSIAHEWWHSLDQALSYYETGRGKKPSTTASADEFTGRPEVLDAVRDILKAINKSGHKARLESVLKYNPEHLSYSKRKKELAARFFEGYIKLKFAEAGIVVNGFSETQENTPTEEEVKPVIPAFDRLFKVLKEKEGKKEGSTVLFHIGQEVDQIENERRVSEEASELATETALTLLKDNNLEAEIASDEQAQEIADAIGELDGIEAMTTYHGSPHKFDSFDHSHMGEGEGAQAHGWGTYVARSSEVGTNYAKDLTKSSVKVLMNGEDVTNWAPKSPMFATSPTQLAAACVRKFGEDAIYFLDARLEYYNELESPTQRQIEQKRLYEEAIKIYKSSTWSRVVPSQNFYTVEIPEDTGDNYFDEANPNKEQVEKFYNACVAAGLEYVDVIEGDSLLDNRPVGKKIMQNLAKILGSAKAASEFMSNAGFVGIKYDGRRDGECYVIFNEADAKITDRIEFYQTPNGTIYGWTDGKKIYLTKAGINPNTPIHEYTHLWAKAMMQKNPKGWDSIKQLLKNTPVWKEVINDSNYKNIKNDEDAVASEVLSRISGSKNAAKLEQMAQKMIDDAKGTMRKVEARGLIQNIKDALNQFWSWVGKELFGIEKFNSIDEITDRVLYDLVNKTDLNKKVDTFAKETEFIKEQAIADGTFMKAPNGEPTKLTERQWLTVRTKAFKKWFGDWELAANIKHGIDALKKLANGAESVQNAMRREELSRLGGTAEIEFTWGKEGNIDSNGNIRKGYGFAKILQKHGVDDALRIVGTIATGKVKEPYGPDNARRVDIVSGEYHTTISLFKDGVSGSWVLTGFKIDPSTDAKGRGSDLSNATQTYPIHTREDLGAALESETNIQYFNELTRDVSKVVDENGEPLVVYHGSPYGNIEEFDRKGRVTSGLREYGSYFSTNYRLAQLYAYARKQAKGDIEKYEAEKARLDAIIFNENTDPRTALDAFDELDKLEESQKPKVYEVFLNIRNPKVFDAEMSNGYRGWHKLKQDVGYDIKYGHEAIEALAGHNSAAIMDQKYDGIIAKNMADVHSEDGLDELMGDVFLVFDETPSNIKSANRNTTFTSENPNIYFQIEKDDKTTPENVAKETAAQTYDRVVNEDWQEFQRQFQDAFQPVRIAIEAIQAETGNIPIEDYENYLLIQNQMSSRSRNEIDRFREKHYSPIIEQVNTIIDKIMESRGMNKKNEAARAEVYKEVKQYLIAKHGLERNKYYQTHKTRLMKASEMKPLLDEAEKDYQTEVNMINMNNNLTDAERELLLRDAKDVYDATVQEIKSREVPDMRDYAGLTSLFGLEAKEWEQAEEQAQELIDEFEKNLGREDNEDGEMIEQSKDIEALWKRINSATDKTLRHSYESGLLSRAQYNEIKEMFKFYVPLRGFEETTAEDVYNYARFEGNRFNAAVHKAKGRTSVADDPIAIIMNMAESEIAQGNKNRAKQALYNYLLNRAGAMNEQNSLMQLEDVWYLVDVDEDGNKTYQIVTPDHESGETYEEFENKMQALAEEGRAEKSRKGKLDIGYRFQKQDNRNSHYVFVKINGVEKAIYINGDPKAADAINGRYQSELGDGIKKFRDVQRIISSFFTNYSLEFTARNYFRDMIYSHINIDVRESDPAYRKKFRQNWRHNNMRSMMKMLKAYRAGEYDGRALTEDEAAFVEFMENGGQTGYTLINSVDAHKKDLENAIQRMQNGIVKGGVKDSTIFKATLGGIELLNEASELVTRFAAFKTSRDMGRGINTSIKDAKEITVNFNTKGAQDGQGWMGAVARYFGWCKYFFNASVQGVQNLKAMRDANKLKFGTTVGGIMATGFLMPVFVSAISELLGGDDEDEYWNIPEYERQNNFCIPLGNGKYVKIPLPIGFREIYGMGDMFAASLMDKKFNRNAGQVGVDMANKIATVILPINPLESTSTGLNIWQTFLYTALPSSAQFAIQNATNVDWKGTPLQKEYTYNEDDPQWMKAFASNPDWMTGLSKWCNEHINLDGDYKGMDWSPEKLDNTLSNLLGGVYTLIKKSGKTLSMIWNEENRNLSNVPLGGVVLGSGIDSDDRFVTDTYHDMKDFYDDNLNYIKRRAEKFGYDLEDVFLKEKGKHHPKMLDIYQNKNFDFMQEWYKGNKELDELNREIKKIKKEIAEKENPSTALLNKLAKKQDKFDAERRDFVNDMLELD